jgi:hypothetical protein
VASHLIASREGAGRAKSKGKEGPRLFQKKSKKKGKALPLGRWSCLIGRLFFQQRLFISFSFIFLARQQRDVGAAGRREGARAQGGREGLGLLATGLALVDFLAPFIFPFGPSKRAMGEESLASRLGAQA